MKAVKELAELTPELTDADRNTISAALPDLMVSTETPRTPIAIVKFKHVLKKAGAAFAAAVRQLFVDVSAETIKKVLFEP